MSQCKISVALCTYNGEKYLREQLESIFQQTLPVHEIILCDDGSKDRTLDIAKEFIGRKSIDFQIFSNEKNLGSTKNFEACALKCTGDIIFFADQDDRWLPNKVNRTLEMFDMHPEWQAVFSNAEIIDSNGKQKGKTSFESIEFTEKAQENWRAGKAFDILLRGYVVTGATLAVRSKVIDKLFPTPDLFPELIHDGWAAMYLAAFNQIGFTNECLIEYREHESQQVGFRPNLNNVSIWNRLTRGTEAKLEKVLPKLQKAKALNEYFSKNELFPENVRNKIFNRYKHFEFRYNLPKNRILRIVPIFEKLVSGSYKTNEVGKWWRTVLGDIFE